MNKIYKIILVAAILFCICSVVYAVNRINTMVDIPEEEEPPTTITIKEMTIEERIGVIFDDKRMLAVAKAESELIPDIKSKTDITKNGYSFSIGLFQINLTVHNIGGLHCPNAFSGRNYDAVMINYNLYSACVAKASDPNINIIKAKQIYDRNGIKAWGSYTDERYLTF